MGAGVGRRRIVGALLSAVVVMGLVTIEVASSAAATTTLSGTLRVTAHVRRDNTTKILYTLETASGVKTLKLPGVPPETMKTRKAVKQALKANPDRLVQVTARPRKDGTFAVLSVTPLQTPPPLSEPAPLTPQNKNVAFVIVHWSQLGWNGVLNENDVRAWALTDPNSLAAYYRATTNNIVRVNGTVMTVTLPGGPDIGQTCVPWEAVVKRTQENPALMARLAPYTNVMFLPQYTASAACSVIGIGNVSGRYSALSGSWTKDLGKFVHVASHEFGHNLGLLHAGVVRCAGIVPTDACLSDDVDNYGDPYDTMGNRYPPAHFSSVHKQKLKTLAPAAITTATPGTAKYWLYASDAPGAAGPRLLVVPRGATGQLYNLEVRSANTQFGVGSGSAAVGGISIRLSDAYGTTVTSHDDTVLIDMEPSTPSGWDAPLMPGRTYADPANGVRISVDFVANPWAVVTITR
jgi:hypothetical protein